MITLHNLRFEKMQRDFDFRIDRESALGNPHLKTGEEYREESIRKFDAHFKRILEYKDFYIAEHQYLDRMFSALKKYKTLRLFCWCAPLDCHGEIIKKYLLRRYEDEVGE